MIPLVVRSHYSLMWGTADPELLCRAARFRGYSALALTDTDNLYGLWRFLSACREYGVRPIIGAEVSDVQRARRAVCLVENETGFRNLCRLLSRRHLDADFSLEQALARYAEGLQILTSSGSLLKALRPLDLPLWAALPRRMSANAMTIKATAKALQIPAVAVPSSFFLDAEDHETHRVVRAIALNTSLSRLEPGDAAPAQAYLAHADEYAERFAAWPELLHNGEVLAERLAFRGPAHGVIMPPWSENGTPDADAALKRDAYLGAQGRYGGDLTEPVVERLEHELRVIREMGFSSYFLVVRDIVRRSPRICGRGSGAASLVAYCLGITNVCPVKHNLYFERFLNPGRKDPPDIDVDFAWDERDAVLESVLNEFEGHAAMVCNHVLFQPRMAIREVAKVFGLTDREIGQVARRLPWFWRVMDSDEELLARLRSLPELGELDFPDPWPRILPIAQRLIGQPRYLSVHPGGVVITPEPIDSYAPVQRAPKGVPILQWEKDGTEEAGLVKIDLLGNRSLGVIRDALANAAENACAPDERDWEPEDDIPTQHAVAAGHTMGCFYIESPATRQLQRKAGVGDFEHVVIHSSIIRPAANAFIREYVRRMHGGGWQPIHPLLEDVLDETYGIMVYQEDVSRAAVAMAGFSHADADGLRKAMSRKDREKRLRDYAARFQAGARARGVSDEQIAATWEMMMSFDGYSFCKPHSASYARVSFQSAYLKVHCPAEFIAAVISNQGGFYSTFAYVSEARRMGLTILAPDVNQSRIAWHGCGEQVRVGLMAIKGLSQQCMQRLIEQRTHAGPFAGFADFMRRVRPDEEEARNLILAGALDLFEPDRARLLWRLARWRYEHRREKRGQIDLFAPPGDRRDPELPAGEPIDAMRAQFEVLGFLCERHPMSLFRKRLAGRGLTRVDRLEARVGRRVRFAGWLITGKVVQTKHGEPMEFLSFEDETGIVETTFFPKAYRRFCAMLDRGRPYILSGRVEKDYGAISVSVDDVERVNG